MTQALYKKIYHEELIALLHYLSALKICGYKFDYNRSYTDDPVNVIL